MGEAMSNGATNSKLAAAFQAQYPPTHGATGSTYFGGRPQLPGGLAWPTVTTGGVAYALNFLGQVDLSDVARVLPNAPLPGEGVLYFFLDTSLITDGGLQDWTFEKGRPWRVLFAPHSSPSATPAAAPRDRIPCFGVPFENVPDLRVTYPGPPWELNWTQHVRWRQRYYAFEFPRIAVKARRFESSPHGTPSGVKAERLQRAFGPPVPHIIHPQHTASRGQLWRPDAGFPATRIYLEIAAGGLLKATLGPFGDQRLQTLGKPHVDALKGLLAGIGEASLFAATSTEERSRINRILDDLVHADDGTAYKLNEVLRDAYVWGTVLSLTHSRAAAQTVPEPLVKIPQSLFAPFRRAGFQADKLDRIDTTLHQMLGNGAEVQGQAAERQESHVLLMQFDTDKSLGWMFGDMGNAQFWITPDDLAARRFERVTCTVEGH
jgi:uncharacterized protein DUF1963